MPRKSTKPAWSDVKRRIKSWNPPELIGLVQDLFKLSADNRHFLAAWLLRQSAREVD